MKIAIHQPNFFPWLGFFNKIYVADIFVYLNHVENNPRTAIYTKRVKLLVNKQEYWLTCPLKNEAGKVFIPINQMVIENPEKVKNKHLKTLELNYKRAPYFAETFPLVELFYNHPSNLISERNISIINSVCEALNISTKKIQSDALNINTSSNQLLIDIVKQLDGNCYIPGGGAQDYQDDDLFAKSGVKLHYQNFVHPSYKQFNSEDFVKGLSIIDCLMSVGIKETEKLVKNG